MRLRFIIFPVVTVLLGPAKSFAAPDSLGWNNAQNGAFTTAICRDQSGALWVGTEDNGVSRQVGGKWQKFTTKDGLGDNNAYALATDRLGRVWVGHLNHGVSVWNGQSWRNYGVLDGPLGERVNAIAVSPVDGDVWIAHNAGLTRYSIKQDCWIQFTTAQGFPTTEISALAFDSVGDLYVATQHDGVLIGKSDDDFAHWARTLGASKLPLAPAGNGLPSNFTNDVVVGDDDVVYVATDTGLARSNDFGATWSYIRGADWEEKCKGLRPPAAPQYPATNLNRELLREDYVTNLAEDGKGLLWIGYRRKGYEIRRPRTDRTLFISAKEDSDKFPYASTILPGDDGRAALAYYGEGVQNSVEAPAFVPTADEAQELAVRRGWKLNIAEHTPISKFPKPASAPTPQEFDALLKEVQNHTPLTNDTSSVVALPDDWTTEGDWLGRYGRYWADLCAMISPQDLIWGAGPGKVDFQWEMGPNSTQYDSARYWIHWLQTDNKRVLEMPPMYADSRFVKGLETDPQKYRRQSEIDDHGETYPMTMDGPSLRFSIRIPKGDYVLSFFNHNKDGHTGFNRARDYKISIRPHRADLQLYDTSDFAAEPELLESRQRDFWGSVYKRFVVRGPQELTVEINRNYSFNTIMAGVFLDTLDEEPFPYFGLKAGLNETVNTKTLRAEKLSVDDPSNQSAEALWAALESARETDPLWWQSSSREMYGALVRYYEAAKLKTPAAEMDKLWVRLGTCYCALNLREQWEDTERRRGLVPARDIELGIRWDGRFDDRGAGFESVMAYSTAKAGLDHKDVPNSLPISNSVLVAH